MNKFKIQVVAGAYQIQVRKYAAGENHHSTDKFELVEVVTCRVWAEQIGNFNPLFCRYKGKRIMVHSDAGDLSDPFQRTEDYAKTFFIEIA
jgi:hypothetical protein